MDSTEEKLCIVCDGEGELLACSDDDCPIFVHRSCIGCKPYVDPMGNYYCSYCTYRRLTGEAKLLQKKAMVAKQQLSIFLEKETSNGSQIEQDKREVTTSTSKEKTCLEDDNSWVCDDVQSLCEEQADGSPNKSGENSGNNDNTCRIMVVYTPNLNLDDACGVDSVLDKGDKMKRKAVLVESDDTKGPKVVNQTENANPKCGESVDDHTDTGGNIINNQEVPQKDSSDSGTHAPISFQKPGRVLWSNEEVEKLKEGVEKYSQKARKNLPWKKILEFGRDTFNPSRTPSDLKDKWRNITK